MTIVKSHLEEDYDSRKKLEKKREFEVKTIPNTVKQPLVEFIDITPSEMPNCLPLIRHI